VLELIEKGVPSEGITLLMDWSAISADATGTPRHAGDGKLRGAPDQDLLAALTGEDFGFRLVASGVTIVQDDITLRLCRDGG
jgi:hypothetical protein